MEDKEEKVNVVCCWIGDGEGCRHPTMYRQSYCEKHHERMYMALPCEMADYILEKELKTNSGNRS